MLGGGGRARLVVHATRDVMNRDVRLPLGRISRRVHSKLSIRSVEDPALISSCRPELIPMQPQKEKLPNGSLGKFRSVDHGVKDLSSQHFSDTGIAELVSDGLAPVHRFRKDGMLDWFSREIRTWNLGSGAHVSRRVLPLRFNAPIIEAILVAESAILLFRYKDRSDIHHDQGRSQRCS